MTAGNLAEKAAPAYLVHACPVCGDKDHVSLLCRADGADIYTCATCTADHVHPMPSERALKAYYDRREWFEGGEKGGYENYDAQTSADMMGTVLAPFAGRQGLSILDVGCGYGTHLATAAKQGWKCFGVEPSAHARAVAQERLGGSAYIVENVSDLIPHEFDVVLLLDVLEHLRSPYPTLYQLFSIGAISAKTLVVITTPNAGSNAARANPAAWEFRHPASHLVHYTAKALSLLLMRLHFQAPDVRGTTHGEVADSAGLLATAKGSDFSQFMQERYVPGTFSKLAEYEHLPRYALAKTLAKDKTVLDFGCGTGYGTAMMAEVAARVTGLDIDAAALTWAAGTHRNPRLTFERHADLGATLPAASFDLITCFEMIEHVDHATQKAAVASMARLLRDDGTLVISTPNPAVTALYGANPYHLREMNEAELGELLHPHFQHVKILRQHVRVGVSLGEDSDLRAAAGEDNVPALAFIAVCSRKAVPAISGRILFDNDVDYVAQFMRNENALNRLRLEAYTRGETAQSLTGELGQAIRQLGRVIGERDNAQAEVKETIGRLMGRERELMDLEQRANAIITAKQGEIDTLTAELDSLTAVRAAEHASPRFLFRQLIRATRARIRQKLRGG